MSFLKRLQLAAAILRLAAVSTDKGELRYEGELAVGVEVGVVDGEETRAAEDGEYTLEDGRVIVVAEGKIAEIREAEEPEEEPVAMSATELRNQLVSLRIESYIELERALYDALVAAGYEYPWIVDYGEDWAVIETYDEDGKLRYHRIAYTQAEDGVITIGESVEVFPRFVTAEEAESLKFETQEEIDAMKAAIEEKDARIAELEARIAELEEELNDDDKQEPAAIAASKVDRPNEGSIRFNQFSSTN